MTWKCFDYMTQIVYVTLKSSNIFIDLMMLHFLFSCRQKQTAEEVDGDNSVDLSTPTSKRSADAIEDHKIISDIPPKIARFELEPETSENDWDLPVQLVEYVRKYMDLIVTEKEVKEHIMNENPVPKNIRKVQELDSYMKDLLVENNKTQTLQIEKLLKAAQEREWNILGPLSKLWSWSEEERGSLPDDESVTQFQTVANLFEQSIALVAHACHRSAHQRRVNILSTLIENNAKVTDLLKSNADSFNDPNVLFGEKFEEVLQKSVKSKKKSSEIGSV